MRYLWRKFQFHCLFSFLLDFFPSQMCSVESLKAFSLLFLFSLFLLCGIHSLFLKKKSLRMFLRQVPVLLFCFWRQAAIGSAYIQSSLVCSVSYLLLSFFFASSLPFINCYVRVSCDFHKTSFPLFKKICVWLKLLDRNSCIYDFT